MRNRVGLTAGTLALFWILASTGALAKPFDSFSGLMEEQVEADVIGDVAGEFQPPRKALQDTVWIADWSFDTGAPCDGSGWLQVDERILFNGENYWHIETGIATTTGIAGNSYAVGYHDKACCNDTDGYDNDWYQGIRIEYTGSAAISFDYVTDTEEGWDFLQIETDSACSSYDRVDFDVDPKGGAAPFRTIEAEVDGLVMNGEFVNLSLTNYGPGTHCVYIAFFSDSGWSPCDGIYPTTIGEAAVIDNISINDDSGMRTEDFEDGTLDIGTAMDMAERASFGTWARLFQHVTDNDICSENTTCAWLLTDHVTPTLANDPSMAFGPDAYVVRNWLDNSILSPWVSLETTPGALATHMQYRVFPGNRFNTSRIVRGLSYRAADTEEDASSCPWRYTQGWSVLNSFAWVTGQFQFTPEPAATRIQVRLRVSDWQFIAGAPPPSPHVPGPGPYIDRVRIGRTILTGPTVAVGFAGSAQDAFATEVDPAIPPGTGEHFRASTDRFGTAAFSQSGDIGWYSSPNLITGDSIVVFAADQREAGGIVHLGWYGAIVSGPHVGKAPPPWTVGSNGFFQVSPDSVRNEQGVPVEHRYFVDLDDEYLRGGDVLLYFWLAEDAQGGVRSNPQGLTSIPASIEDAERATQGLREVSFLPRINWDPGYLARIAADPHGVAEPTEQELAGSTQATCILYVQQVSNGRRSGDINRTSFMYTLDRLGYRGSYDVYDHQGLGTTNNQLGGRATIQQAQGYSLIVYDMGNLSPSGWQLPDGSSPDVQKIDQAGWFSAWLAQASLSEAEHATLWIIGSNVLEEKSGMPGSGGTLLNTHMGVTLQSTDQGLNVNPDVVGMASFTFDKGSGASMVDFAGDGYTVNGGCPIIRNYDAAEAGAATSVATHRYRSPTTNQLGDAAIVMNRNDTEAYNTIMQTHPWFDIRSLGGTPAAVPPELDLLSKILGAALPANCLRAPTPTDAGSEPELAAPVQTVLRQNVPNPFNPMTTILFDLAQDGPVTLKIYDVTGRLIRTLIDEVMEAGRNQRIVWNGLDDQRLRVSSGVYFYRLETVGSRLTKKLVVMK